MPRREPTRSPPLRRAFRVFGPATGASSPRRGPVSPGKYKRSVPLCSMRDSSPRDVPAAAVAPGPFPGCGRYSGQKPAVSPPEQAFLRRSLRTGSEDGRSPAHPAPQEPPPSRILRPRIQPFSAAPGHTYAAHQRSPPLPSMPPHGFSRFLRAFAHGTSKASAHDAAERTQKE